MLAYDRVIDVTYDRAHRLSGYVARMPRNDEQQGKDGRKRKEEKYEIQKAGNPMSMLCHLLPMLYAVPSNAILLISGARYSRTLLNGFDCSCFCCC